jgi:hypothetical protein
MRCIGSDCVRSFTGLQTISSWMATWAIAALSAGVGLYTASRLGVLRALQKRWIGSTEAQCAHSELSVLSKAGCVTILFDGFMHFEE